MTSYKCWLTLNTEANNVLLYRNNSKKVKVFIDLLILRIRALVEQNDQIA